jgi:predicted RNA binding protein YcfA (HicA-like mRNA interferase family)
MIRRLGKAGFAVVGQRGSHVKLRNADARTVIVPRAASLRPGTLHSILRQASLTRDEFEELR